MNNLQKEYIKKKFDEIVKLCEDVIPEYGESASYFMEPATEEEIVEWEKTTNIKMPESYKLWLSLTKKCQIRHTLAEFYFPDIVQMEFLPKDYVMIGSVIGDGEIVCFLKSNNKFIRYFEGKINGEFDDFGEVLTDIISMLTGDLGVSMEEKLLMLEKLKEIRRRKAGNIE